MSSKHHTTRGSVLVIILSIVAVVALSGAVAYTYIARNGNTSGGALVAPKTITATTPDGVKALLTNAMAGKYDAKCTYTTTSMINKNDTKPVTSTLYIHSAKKMRVDTPISNKPGHMLWLGESVYIWTDGDSKGSILPITNDGNGKTYTPEGFSSKVKEYRATCQSVPQISESMFTKPSKVEFVDFNAQIKSSS